MIPTKSDNTQKPQLRTKLFDGDKGSITHQIVELFAKHANTKGIRAIPMGDLAKELRISTKTLYKNFRTKEDIIYELVVKWEKRVHKPITYYGDDLIEILRTWLKIWIDNDAQFSTEFWTDLKTDYPQLYKVYVDSLYYRIETLKIKVAPYLKEGINPEFAWQAYFILMTACSQAKTFETLKMTREECVFEAFDFWIQGAVDLKRIKEAVVSD